VSTARTPKQAYICIDQQGEEMWVNSISDGSLKPEQEILLIPEVNMMIYLTC
jgi:hypothetical protein